MAFLLAAVLAVTTVGSCSIFTGDDELPAEPMGSSGAVVPEGVESALVQFYEQDVAWEECRDGLHCADVRVPLDYEKPAGKSLTLSVLKVPARDQDGRVGSLVVNPGGPGASGVDYAAQYESFFGPDLLRAFDIVGFDPRGVGSSTPVDCLDDAGLDAFVAGDPDPDTPAEVREAVDQLEEFGAGCVEKSGELAAHMSTEEAARDIDILRAVLGEQQLGFFGASYGTYLGATYADLFPERVGRMVLDGAVDPMVGAVERGLVQARGFEVALRAYVEDCVDGGDCYLGSSVDDGTQRIRELLDALDKAPIRGQGDRELTEGLAVFGIWLPLYNSASWPALDTALAQAFDGDGSTLVRFADLYLGRGPDGYRDNSYEALYAVNCLDPQDEVTVEEAQEQENRFLEASPTFGRVFAFSLASCSRWPVEPRAEQEPLDAPGANPILVIGTSRDPATPLEWAEGLAEQLDSGVLIRRDGDGHTGYRAGNGCVDQAVESYLVSGEVPNGTLDC